jgi:hypothetical protein
MVKCLLLVGLLCSCAAVAYLPDIEAETMADLNMWVWRNVRYVVDVEQHTQTAEETLIKRTGDCEDQAILLKDICEELLGIYPVLKTLWHYGEGHTIVEYDGN